MRSTFALSGYNITGVVVSTTIVTITGLAALLLDTQSIKVRRALVTISSNNIAFAKTFAGSHIASLIADGAIAIAGALLTTIRIILVEVPVATHAGVTPSALNIRLAMALSSDSARQGIVRRIAEAVIKRTTRITIARHAGVRLWSKAFAVEHGKTLLAVLAICISTAVLANSSRKAAGDLEDGTVIMALISVAVAFALHASVRLAILAW